MNFIAKNYSGVSLIGAFLAGVVAFLISFGESRDVLIRKATRTIQVVTNVKRELLESKVSMIEQQLNFLSKNTKLNELLSTLKMPDQFDEYVKSILYSQGYTNLWVIRETGEILYATSPIMATIPPEIQGLAQKHGDSQDPKPVSIILSENEPQPFYFYKPITDARGSFRGILCLEIPKELFSTDLHNTISMDSLNSYLVSSRGIMNQSGKVAPDTCVSCRWSGKDFIQFSPDKKIGETWTLLSVYPVSQIDIKHIAYASMLDGLIAFFVAAGIVMVIIYSVQAIQHSKGITHADIMLVQTTWNALSEYSNKIIAGFYKYLFADAPEVKPMFKSSQAEQEKRMALMINTIVNSADSLEEFKGSIAQLAKRHVHMGVKREYFPIVVKAIISSVEEQYGKGFTPAHKKAWYKILNQVSAIMLEEMESYQRALRDAGSGGEQEPLIAE